MTVTPFALRALFTRISLEFEDMQKNYVDLSGVFTTSVPSASAFNTYAWLGLFPQYREWIGPKHINELASRAFVIKNRTYENTVGLSVETIDDGDMATVDLVTKGLMTESLVLKYKLAIDALLAGPSTECYDGQFLFDTDHPVSLDATSGTQRNYYASGMALTPVNFQDRRAEMMTWRGENGKSFRSRPTHLLVPPQLESAARQILNAEMTAVGTAFGTNINAGLAEVVVVPEMADYPTMWVLVDGSQTLKPIIAQERKAPQIVAKTSMTDDSVFFNNQFVVGAEARYGVGAGAWQTAMMCVG